MGDLNLAGAWQAIGNDRGTIVVARVWVTRNGGRGTVTLTLGDAAGNEIYNAAASVHKYDRSDAQIENNSVTIYVPKGMQFKVAVQETNPSIAWDYDRRDLT